MLNYTIIYAFSQAAANNLKAFCNKNAIYYSTFETLFSKKFTMLNKTNAITNLLKVSGKNYHTIC